MDCILRVRELRIKAGLNQAELAKAMGYAAPSAVTMWESGERKVPSDKLPQLARVLGCTIEALLAEDNAETA